MSPASYLTAPPRGAAASIAPLASAPLALFWFSLVLAILVGIASAAFVAVRGLRLYRDARTFAGEAGVAAEVLSRSADALGSRAAAETEQLERSIARLRVSTTRLSILLDAISQVRAQAQGLKPKK
jgi:hypothetical protein